MGHVRPMDHEFWLSRWRQGRIGFHEGRPNEHLVAHEAGLALAGARVLVPLCGKAVDLEWLAARAGEVVGIELATEAVEAFFAERGLVPQRTQAGPRTAYYELGNLVIWAGDVFELDAATLGAFEVCFDRAALVALRPEDRARYIEHLRSLEAPGARKLLVTFEHDGPTSEPPFSVPEELVRSLHARLGHEVERLAERDVFDPAGMLAARGATYTREKVFRIASLQDAVGRTPFS